MNIETQKDKFGIEFYTYPHQENERHYTTANTAKHVRRALKATFPGQKFSVRSSTFSMGSSVDISWIDGPTTGEVDTIVDVFAYGRFDGSIDLAYSVKHWVTPDGVTGVLSSPGSRDCGGYTSATDNPLPQNAVTVSWGAKYVGTSRDYSRAACEDVCKELDISFENIEDYNDKTSYIKTNDYEMQTRIHKHRHQKSWYTAPAKKTINSKNVNSKTSTKFSVSHDRDWTWVTFDGKPPEETRDILNTQLNARWSRRRKAWYIRECVEEKVIRDAIGNVPQYNEETPPAMPGPAQPKGNEKLAARLEKIADNMTDKIEDKLNPAISHQNVTARRARIAEGMYQDGKSLQNLQKALYALAKMHREGVFSFHELETVKSKKALDNLSWSNPVIKGWVKSLENKEDDAKRALKKMETEIKLTKIPGFFATPQYMARRMVENLSLQPDDRILEPSAGSGALLDELPKDSNITAIEYNYRLYEFLQQKGYAPINQDFLGYDNGKFNKIVMNPPFEKKADIDHVLHAWDMLEDGGILVSIISGGTLQRSDKKSMEFKNFVDNNAMDITDYRNGEFKESGTGVSSTMIVLHK